MGWNYIFILRNFIEALNTLGEIFPGGSQKESAHVTGSLWILFETGHNSM